MMATGFTNREALIALSAQCEPGDARVGRAIRQWGAREVVSALQEGRPGDVGCAEVGRRWQAERTAKLVDLELSRAGAADISFVASGDRGWPTQLGDLGDRAPLILRCVGVEDLRLVASRSVAIVGARSCTRYGAAVADSIAADLAASGIAVVSGGAFGIDARAHLGALASDGLSVLVTAGGADQPTPRGNWRIFDRIRAAGCVVSEVPIGRTPGRRDFLVRNRLIASLARVTVVIEAGSRSGATRTVAEASDMCRPVGAVPGPVTSAMSVGCHRLLRSGSATLVRDAADVMELMGGPDSLELVGGSVAMSDRIRQLMSDLPTGLPLSACELADRCGSTRRDVEAELVLLRERGLVRQMAGGWLRIGQPSPRVDDDAGSG